jgi:DNA-binding HxlR family transcriptional regulator
VACSVAGAPSVVGDRYSSLIIREIAYSRRRFAQLLENVALARCPLSEAAPPRGVRSIERRRYSERPPRYENHLTESGTEPRAIVLALKEWGGAPIARGA